MKPIHAHLLLLVISVVITGAVAAAYIYMYQEVDVSANRAQTALRTAKAEESSGVLQKNTEELFLDSKDDRARLPGFFISSDAAVQFIESLEHLGPQSGTVVTIDSVSADDPAQIKAGTTAYLHAHVATVGSWSNVMRALRLAEVLPYTSKVSAVSLVLGDIDPKDPKNHKWQGSFTVTAPLLVVKK